MKKQNNLAMILNSLLDLSIIAPTTPLIAKITISGQNMGSAVRRFLRNQANSPIIPNGTTYSIESIRSEAVRIASLAFCYSCRAKHTFETLFSSPLNGSTAEDTANYMAEHDRLAMQLRTELDVIHRSTFALMSAATNLGIQVSCTVSAPAITEFEHYNYHPLPPSPGRVVGDLLAEV
jgi:hypothetical protein